MYQLRQSRMSHGQLASRRVYFLLGIITRLPTHATLNTVNSPPFRTEVSSLNVFFLVSTSFIWTAVINIINPWIVPDYSPSTITRTDRNSWSPLTTHIKANLLVGMCPTSHIPVVSWLRLIRPPSILQLSKSISIFIFFLFFFKYWKFIFLNFFSFFLQFFFTIA